MEQRLSFNFLRDIRYQFFEAALIILTQPFSFFSPKYTPPEFFQFTDRYYGMLVELRVFLSPLFFDIYTSDYADDVEYVFNSRIDFL
uniref:Uncharacterized protein n=1 Tax=Rhizophagus irregularis (strain DAOM 181602 / DAOM 197198 / MUCL 43194) TaxID=747089 RepID=U9TZ62_RHIID